jgi:hypothetical protein
MKHPMKCIRLLPVALTLFVAGFGVSANANNFLTELKISSSETVPLPPGSWKLHWKNDFDFCRPENRAQCRDTDGRVLILTNQTPDNSPFQTIIIRHTNRSINNWNNNFCYSKTGNSFFDNHGTRENHTLNKCSYGNFGYGTGVFFSSSWWWSTIREGTEQIPTSNSSNAHLEILLQTNGKRRYQLDVLLKAEHAGTRFNVDQINAWKQRYVDALTAGVFDKKPAVNMASLQLTDAPVATAATALSSYFETTQNQYQALQANTEDSTPVVQDVVLPAFFTAGSWSSPIDLERQVVMTPINTLKGDDTFFMVDSLATVSSPAHGRLVYRGELHNQQTGFVIDHGQGVFSVLSSSMPWNIRYGPVPGDPVTQNQFLTSVVSKSNGVTPPVQWSLVYRAPGKSTNNIDAQWLEGLKTATKLNTRLIASIGSTVVRLGKAVSDDNAQLKLNGTPLALELLTEAAILTPLENQSLELTAGRLFKSTISSALPLEPARTLEKTVRKNREKQWVIDESEYFASNLSKTQEVFAQLGQAPLLAALPTPKPVASPVVSVAVAAPAPKPTSSPQPVVPTAEAMRIKALEAELEMFKQLQKAAPAVAAVVPKVEEPKVTSQRSRRHALVIGNAKYTEVPVLDNSVHDAKAISESLKGIGYEVSSHFDLNQRSFNRVIREFTQQLKGGEEVLFYFAGHGVQLGSSNYLLPIDVGSDSPNQVRDESIDLQNVLDNLAESRAKFTLAMVDACRDNPFKGNGRSIGGRGLAPTSAATGQMILFSAGAGQQALDKLGPQDKERNGVFTRVLLKEMQKPGVPVDGMLRKVRQEVVRLAKSVGHEQVPALYDQTVGEFYLNPK